MSETTLRGMKIEEWAAEVERLRSELKVARDSHADTVGELQRLRSENAELRKDYALSLDALKSVSVLPAAYAEVLLRVESEGVENDSLRSRVASLESVNAELRRPEKCDICGEPSADILVCRRCNEDADRVAAALESLRERLSWIEKWSAEVVDNLNCFAESADVWAGITRWESENPRPEPK